MSSKRLALLLVATAGLMAFPANALGYGWPVKPFSQQHPIRGAFDDPRCATKHLDSPGPSGHCSFHFGVDIAVPDGTPVYSVSDGLVHTYHDHVTVATWSIDSFRTLFGYWHIRPVVRKGQPVHLHQLLGYVMSGYGHVHFAESHRIVGQYVNPLRVGGLTPYHDYGKPTIVSVSTYTSGGGEQQKSGKHYEYLGLSHSTLSGTVDIVVNAFDSPPKITPWPFAVLTPTLIRWQLKDESGRVVVPTRTVVDFLWHYTCSPEKIYAPGTLQNGPNRAGVYNFWLARSFDTTQLPDGSYYLHVSVADVRGNRSGRTYGFEISN